jgi:hypothetical protein
VLTENPGSASMILLADVRLLYGLAQDNGKI